MKNKVIDTPPNPNKRGGPPSPLDMECKHDGTQEHEEPLDPSYLAGVLSRIKTISSDTIKGQISALRVEFAQAGERHAEAERAGQVIDRQIRNLQAQCPHQITHETSVLDCAEMKTKRFCQDCGAQL